MGFRRAREVCTICGPLHFVTPIWFTSRAPKPSRGRETGFGLEGSLRAGGKRFLANLAVVSHLLFSLLFSFSLPPLLSLALLLLPLASPLPPPKNPLAGSNSRRSADFPAD